MTTEIRLVPHPSARKHPTEKDRIIELFPDYRQILVGKVRVGYVKKGKRVTLIKRVDGVELELIKDKVKEWTGEDQEVLQPPKLVKPDRSPESDDEDQVSTILGPDSQPFENEDDDDDN